MAKGGYQIIDFKGINHNTNVGMVHNGIYDLIKGYSGPFMATNVVVENVEIKDVFIHDLHPVETTYEFTVRNGDYTCSITDADVVTFE